MGIRFNARTSAIETDAASIDFTQPITTPASTTSLAGFNIAEGVAPSAPVDGDVWVTAAGAFNARLNGATVDLSAGGGGTPTDITVANEAADTTCFPSFFTAATGDLGPKTNASLTFNSSTGALAATSFSGSGASLTALTAANISSGNLGSGVLPYSTASTTNSAFAIPFINTTGFASGNYGLLLQGTAQNFTFNPSTSRLEIGNTEYLSGAIYPTSSFQIRQGAAGDIFIDCNDNSSVDFYFNGTITARAGGTGIGTFDIVEGDVTGDAGARILYFRDQALGIKASITSGTNSGDLVIDNNVTNKDISLTTTGTGVVSIPSTDLVVGSTTSAVEHSIAAQENSGGISMRILTDGSARISQLSIAGAVEDDWISMTRNAGVALKYNNVNHIFTVSGGVQIDDSIYIAEKAAANSDVATLGQLWVRTATPNELYFTTDAGDDIQITTGTGLAAGGDVTKVGTPANNQVGVWTGDGTIEGAANVTYDGIAFEVSTDVLRVTGAGSDFQNNSGTANVTLSQNWNGTTHEFTFGSAATNWRIEGLTNAAGDTITIADGPTIRIYDPTDSQYFSIVKGSTSTITFDASNSQTITLGSNISTLLCEDTIIDQPILRDYAIEADTLKTPVGTTQTLTYSLGPVFDVDLESVTGNLTITLSGGPPTGTHGQVTVKVTQDSTVARTLIWAGGTFRWAGGTAHPMNSTLNGFSIYTFETWDAGTTWWGGGADYS